MAEALDGDASCQSIVDAKKSGDYSLHAPPDGSSVKNWGQLMKLALSGEAKSLTNLGASMSGRAQPLSMSNTSTTAATSPIATTRNHGHGRGVNHRDSGNHANSGGHGQSGNHVP